MNRKLILRRLLLRSSGSLERGPSQPERGCVRGPNELHVKVIPKTSEVASEGGTTDDLTVQLAVLSVAQSHENPNAHATMEFVWRVLESARCAFGGSSDRNKFLELVGKRAALLFNDIVKKHGLAAMSVEAKITDLLFSLTTPGTQDRTVLEEAYFEETKALQK